MLMMIIKRHSVYMLLLIAAVLTGGGSVPPQNGDIRLVNGTSVRGRLEVYYNQAWGTVCYDQQSLILWEKGAARAACRQLNYKDVKYVNTVTIFDIPEAPESTPILFYELNCVYDDVTDLNNEIEHILRCTHEQTGNCTHAQDMAIECDNSSKYTDSYGSEVRLMDGGTGYPSSGVVEVYLNRRWGPVCAESADANFADTVCRQMGYTTHSGGSAIDSSTYSRQPVLQTLNCKIPQECLSGCFSYPSATENITCLYGLIATVNCTFNEDLKSFNPGSEAQCVVYPPIPVVELAEIIGGVVGGVIMVAMVLVVVLLCCCFISGCPLHTWRERRLHGYDRIN